MNLSRKVVYVALLTSDQPWPVGILSFSETLNADGVGADANLTHRECQDIGRVT